MPGTLASGNPRLNAVVDVDIDNNGKFKYILCKVFDNEKPAESKLIVRGTARAEFHSGIYDELDAQVEGTGVSIECLGGGKIDHNAAEKSITVFGLSQGYGKADHTQTVEILRKRYHDYACITCKD